ncbi:MAG: hypothetical protein RLZZ543_2334 [Bacteroidota bacterium]|jgi:MscS family membrane protein
MMRLFIKPILLVVLFLSSSLSIFAQEFPLDQLSPQSAVYKHFYYLQEAHYQPEKAAEVFGSASATNIELALQLKQIFDSHGFKPDFSSIPSDPEFSDTTNGKQQYNLEKGFPDIYLIRHNNRWEYSTRTMRAIPEIHHAIFPLGTGVLMNLIPGTNQKSFLGLQAWQYIGVLILILFGFLLHKLFTFIIERIVRRLIQRTNVSEEFRMAIHRMAIPISYLVLVQVMHRLFPSLLFPSDYAYYIVLGFDIVEPIFLTIGLYRLVDVFSLILKRRAEQTDTTLDDQLVPLFRKAMKVFVVMFGIIAVLNNLDFNLTALIAGVSIGGLAFALAAQDTIKNMFGSLMIFVDKPFQIGDLVAADGFTGTVEEVGFRSTRIRTGANSLISVPNGKLVDMVVDNLGMRQYRRYKTFINLTYDTPVELIELYVQGLREIVQLHPETRAEENEIHVNEMSTSSVSILFNVFFSSKTWAEELKARHAIILETMRLAEQLGVRLAFPTQTLHIESFPEKKSPEMAYKTSIGDKDARYAAYIAGLQERFQPKSEELSNEHFE